jgi:uncharacterized damage-inducible protein DinB
VKKNHTPPMQWAISNHTYRTNPNSSNDYDERALESKCPENIRITAQENMMSLLDTANMLLKYKAWANDITFSSLADVPDSELYKERKTNFKNIVSTLNHVYVVDDIFKAHLSNEQHGYTSRNTTECPTLNALWLKQKQMDDWYADYIASLTNDQLDKVIDFEYVGGGRGAMTINEIVLHLVNHGSYHRGFVSDMMYQIPAIPPTNDLTVYLRDFHRKA